MAAQIKTCFERYEKKYRLTAEQLLAVMRPHPSFEEAMTEALERLAEKL